MRVLLLGSEGQLGWELKRTQPEHIELVPYDYPKIDFRIRESIENCIRKECPDVIINAAAYTAVDKAEEEPSLAYRINHEAVLEISEVSARQDIYLIHISTDFVFDGLIHRPYKPDDKPAPKSVYGNSKFEGEKAVRNILGGNALIIRTAWLYSSHGQNFVKTMFLLMKEKDSLRVIEDQIGTPTWAHGLAIAVWNAMQKKIGGVYHWTDAGVASWYDFAVAVQEESVTLGLLSNSIPITPIPEKEYPMPAKRPPYSVLDKTDFRKIVGISPVHWRTHLRQMLKELT